MTENKNLIVDKGTAVDAASGECTPARSTTSSSNSVHEDHAVEGNIQLKREVGLIKGISLVLGAIIGSGIFIAPRGILLGSESVGMSLIVWVICSVVSMLVDVFPLVIAAAPGALCYAELGAVLPRSGGTYVYIHQAYGDLPGFMTAWCLAVVLRPSSVALTSLTFGAYVAEYVTPGDCKAPGSLASLFAVLAIMMIMFINCMSVRVSSGLPVIFTSAKVIVLVIIIVIGMVRLGQGHTQYLDPSVAFEGTSTNVLAYGVAFYHGLWAYSGWQILNNLPEEMRNPERDVPLAVLIALPFVTLVYLLTNIAYFTVLSPGELLASNAVAVTFGERTLGVMAFIIPLGVCISTSGHLIGSFLTSPRIAFAAGREGHMLSVLSMVNPNRLTPLPAVALQGSIAIVLNLVGDFDSIVLFAGFISWIFSGAAFVSVLVFRRKYPRKPGIFRVPFLVPICATVLSLFMIVSPLLYNPTMEYLYAFAVLGLGLLVYLVFIKKKRQLPYMDKFNLFIQKLFLVCPTRDYDQDKHI